MGGEQRCAGQVRWFNDAKGYGFVRGDDGREFFVHFTEIQAEGYRSLKEGERVEFAIVDGKDGRPQAGDVVKVGE